MKIIEIGEHKINIWASAKEMPTSRYMTFQKYLLMDSGIGDTMESVNNHFNKLHTFLAHSKIEDAKKEAENLHFNFYSILNEVDYQSRAFACMVHSINDELKTDYSDEALGETLKQLSDLGLTRAIAEDYSDEVKKKS